MDCRRSWFGNVPLNYIVTSMMTSIRALPLAVPNNCLYRVWTVVCLNMRVAVRDENSTETEY